MNEWDNYIQVHLEKLDLDYLTVLVRNIWYHTGFSDVREYEKNGADLIAVKSSPAPDVELILVREEADRSDITKLIQTSQFEKNVNNSVAIAREFSEDAVQKAQESEIKIMNISDLSRLIWSENHHWTFFKCVASSRRAEPKTMNAGGFTILDYHNKDRVSHVVFGRSSMSKLDVEENDVVSINSDFMGVAKKGSLFELDRDYVSIHKSLSDEIDAEVGSSVEVDVIDSAEAESIYVLSDPVVEQRLARNIWLERVAANGTSISNISDNSSTVNVSNMIIETVPTDHCYVSSRTDIQVMDYEGAKDILTV